MFCSNEDIPAPKFVKSIMLFDWDVSPVSCCYRYTVDGLCANILCSDQAHMLLKSATNFYFLCLLLVKMESQHCTNLEA
ncbi:hypothetical protein CK203_005117 [Vitis vinifera]|uniref:Uncharacterized protein n=1 Tax=Vitis vinifera TaxID=29760 RepID=A0A438KEX5_VITVI|nr:hypothetical protein CK203_005117 [Vitis vinifera]